MTYQQQQQQSEALRFERLRAQDGKPLVPPPNMQSLTAQGGLNPAKVQEARQLWESARVESQTRPSYPTEERLFWTAFLLARFYAENQGRPQAQELANATLNHLSDARHRQVMLGMAARNLAAMGDPNGAQQYLSQLDAFSEDLQVDTNYRFSTAYVALVRGDAQTALQVLGSQIDDVPINDAYDTVCGVLRAHAHELMGQREIAKQQLMQLAGSPEGLQSVEAIARSNPSLALCPQTLPQVAETVRQMYSKAVHTKSGINVGSLVLVPLLGVGLVFGGQAVASSLGPPLSNILPGVLIAAVVIASIAFSFRAVLKGPRTRKRLAQSGVRGTAQLLAVSQTGTRVNDQPMLELRMLVNLPDRQPYVAVHKEIVPMIRLAQTQPGATFNVAVDPNDPAVMALLWG